MSNPIKIAELQRAQSQPEPLTYAAPLVVAALPALLRLAVAADRYAWSLSKDGPADEAVNLAITTEFHSALAAFQFPLGDTAKVRAALAAARSDRSVAVTDLDTLCRAADAWLQESATRVLPTVTCPAVGVDGERCVLLEGHAGARHDTGARSFNAVEF